MRRNQLPFGASILPLLIFICVSCGKQNSPPVIDSVTYLGALEAGETITLRCSAVDPDGGSLNYSWTSDDGYLLENGKSSADLQLPEYSGTITASVSVTDSLGALDTASKTLIITPSTEPVWSWSGRIEASQYQYCPVQLNAGWILQGHFQVELNDIGFAVMSEADYTTWSRNPTEVFPGGALVKFSRSQGTDFQASIQTDGTYYFVLNNGYSLFTPKSVSVEAEQVTP